MGSENTEGDKLELQQSWNSMTPERAMLVIGGRRQVEVMLPGHGSSCHNRPVYSRPVSVLALLLLLLCNKTGVIS